MQIGTRFRTNLAKKAGIVVLICGITACSSIYRKHGYIPAQEDLDNVIVGVDTVDTVEASVGRPSGQGLLKDGDWFFVESRWKHRGYSEPEEVERQVVAIRFDPQGVVSNVERFGLENGRVVALSRRVTDTQIGGVGFLSQMLGSFGNFGAGSFINP